MAAAVLDSSFVVAALIKEEFSGFVRERMPAMMRGGLLAPALLVWEVGNVLMSKQRRGFMEPHERAGMTSSLKAFAIDLRSTSSGGLLRTLVLADRHGLTAYDAAYLELALSQGVELATLDRRLATAAASEGVLVHAPF